MSGKGRPASPAPDSQGVEVLTVVWMLTVTTALLCEVAALAVRIVAIAVGQAAARLVTLSAYLIFAAAVIGTLNLLLIPLVLKARGDSPPRGVLVAAVVVGVLPYLVMLLQAAR